MYSPPLLDTPASDRTRVNTTTPYAYTSDSATKLRELRLSPNGSTTSLVEKPQSAALLLPAVKLERAGSRNGTGMRSISPGSYNGTGSGEGDMEGGRSRPQSRNALGPFADMTLLKVDQEVVVWSEK